MGSEVALPRLWSRGWVIVALRLSCSVAWGIFLVQGGTGVFYTSRWILYHSATRKAPWCKSWTSERGGESAQILGGVLQGEADLSTWSCGELHVGLGWAGSPWCPERGEMLGLCYSDLRVWGSHWQKQKWTKPGPNFGLYFPLEGSLSFQKKRNL